VSSLAVWSWSPLPSLSAEDSTNGPHDARDMPESKFAPYRPRPRSEVLPSAPSDVLARTAVEADLGDIARLLHEREGGALSRHHEGVSCQFSDHERSCFHVAEHRNSVVGFGRATYFTPPAYSPPNVAPEGWHLAGLVVDPRFRRRGIGLMLTRERLEWLSRRTNVVFYFANARNRATIDLHRRLGFTELTRDFSVPGVSFQGGVGVLFRLRLGPQPPSERRDHPKRGAT
jgi:ribosomal protein S18 acetylase RimI-like enzyme